MIGPDNSIESAIYAAAFVAEYNRSLESMQTSTIVTDVPRRLEIASTSGLSAANRTLRDYRAVLERQRKGLL